jgi:PTH1 family peptidyl-tRNA hydrolase
MLDSLKSIFDAIEKKDASRSGPPEYIVAGLGNPGRQYDGTRHNTGFAALDALAAGLGATVATKKFRSLCGFAVIEGRRVLLLKPQTFMNLSGEAVSAAANFYKLPMTRVIVLFDDVSLPVGRLRVRPRGSAGGHNGIKSIIAETGTEEFPRVKIGVGAKPRADYDLAKWVLGRIPPEQRPVMDEAVLRASQAVKEIIKSGAENAMNDFNGR